ncbi:MAG TPA: FtsX-like permease family protein [bacterium]|nr:FtsX-like permease family protein [bacterium]HPR87045.1 FtsX-like permease family protein [bacterium]
MLAIRLAFKNLRAAGLRTWLAAAVLSIAFVVMVFYNGLLDGWNLQARNDTRAWEIGGGQYWHPQYDRFDPFSLQEAHALLAPPVQQRVAAGELAPVLIVPATAYPDGRMINVQLKGIAADQRILALPTGFFRSDSAELPALIGRRMAASLKLKSGDEMLVRWRDRNGVFDAREITIAHIFSANVPAIDNGQIWLPLDRLQALTGLENQCTLLIAAAEQPAPPLPGWNWRPPALLLKEYEEVIQAKKAGSGILYGLLFAIALLAIFDTQVLAIFRRQREIGTLMALGMTRGQVIRLFTVEGSVHSLLALFLAALYGLPLLAWLGRHGITMPEVADATGMTISATLIPVYSLSLLLVSVALVIVSAAIVSYLPARRIAQMKPTEALKGRAM